MRAEIATIQGGFGLKEELVTRLKTAGDKVVDLGADPFSDGDGYPAYILPLARAVVVGQVDRGIAICWSGRIGVYKKGQRRSGSFDPRPFPRNRALKTTT